MQPASPRKEILGLVALGLGAVTAVLTLVGVVAFLMTAGSFTGNNEKINDLAATVILGMVPLGVVAFVLAALAIARLTMARKRGLAGGSYLPSALAILLSAAPTIALLAGVVYYVAVGGGAR